jgi:poly-beta-1,6-N-acetyl-D-glucosamine synthase
VSLPAPGVREAPEVGDGTRLLLITPAHNESAHIEQVVASVAAQTRRPDMWVVVDDGSTDDTFLRLQAALTGLDFARLLQTPPGFIVAPTGDRNAAGGPDRTWNFGLEHVDLHDYTHVGKLDGDIVLPPNYVAELLRRFAAEPRLGIAAGTFSELHNGKWRTAPTPSDHVTAPARIYSRECFEAIGGVPAYMGADVITTIYAKMRGFGTETFGDLSVRHLRPMATADGLRRGRERQGAYQYIVHYSFLWILLRSFVVAVRFRPYGLSGLWFLWGYMKAALTHAPRVEDPEWRTFAHAEQRRRIREAVRRRLPLLSRGGV